MTMPAGTPTKPPVSPSANPPEKSTIRFRPEMPKIPGVENARPQTDPEQAGQNRKMLTLILGAAGILAVMVALYVWTNRSARRALGLKASEGAQEVTETTDSKSAPPQAGVSGAANPAEIATVDEVAEPWAAKKFNFVKPFTDEKVPAILIRLPEGGLWAISLIEPFGQCGLEYITDVGAIAARYSYKATHPMVVNPCKRAVYDPLKVGPLGTGTWARGEIVQGEALRPPLSIDVDVQGHVIVAKSIE